MKFFITIFLFFVVLNSCAQNFLVSIVRGDVRCRGKKVQVGDILKLSDSLKFDKQTSFIILINPQNGRYKVSPEPKLAHVNKEWLTIIKEDLHIFHDDLRLSTRDDGSFYNMPASYFNTNPLVNRRILIIDSISIPISNDKYEMSDGSFFFLQYNIKNTIINVILKTKNDSVTIIKKALNSLLDTAHILLGYHSIDGTNTLVLRFQLSSVDGSKLKILIKELKLFTSLSSSDDLLEELYLDLYYSYGKPNIQELKKYVYP